MQFKGLPRSSSPLKQFRANCMPPGHKKNLQLDTTSESRQQGEMRMILLDGTKTLRWKMEMHQPESPLEESRSASLSNALGRSKREASNDAVQRWFHEGIRCRGQCPSQNTDQCSLSVGPHLNLASQMPKCWLPIDHCWELNTHIGRLGKFDTVNINDRLPLLIPYIFLPFSVRKLREVHQNSSSMST